MHFDKTQLWQSSILFAMLWPTFLALHCSRCELVAPPGG
jgi:hypothetical protein